MLLLSWYDTSIVVAKYRVPSPRSARLAVRVTRYDLAYQLAYFFHDGIERYVEYSISDDKVAIRTLCTRQEDHVPERNGEILRNKYVD